MNGINGCSKIIECHGVVPGHFRCIAKKWNDMKHHHVIVWRGVIVNDSLMHGLKNRMAWSDRSKWMN